ncbi:uncharacterized protein PGRI_061630 [Penicillium griseofulvum]|uniref:Uncharacterized protein n=1 Tax=Penicillium patulum TaxID=5078 RepID=A0A135LML7_PENPA|nr:uncharacterized protein PGRI_061630 [Penicillium griseofulvum]KXG50196.1 hypothetical protein PGRI_061630 [Penicillium griseofulvum]
MKAFGILLFILLSLFDLGQGSKLAGSSEMLAMYNAYVLDFLKNGAARTLGPNLDHESLVDFGTFVSRIYVNAKLPRDGVFLSKTPEYSQDTLGQINQFLRKKDQYATDELLRKGDSGEGNHETMLQRLTDIVKSTRGSDASGFSEAWKLHLPEFKRALAGTQGARLSDMFKQSLKPLFEKEYPGKTLKSSSFPVMDTDVRFDRENWGMTLTANDEPETMAQKYKTWYVGLREDKSWKARSYISHQKITTSIGRSLTMLDSLDSCD